MIKVLILAYDFPPYVSVGSLRPYSWYKYLKEFDVFPIVLTRQWGNKYGNQLDYIAPSESFTTIIEDTNYGKIIRTPYTSNIANKILLNHGTSKFKLIRKSITAFYEYSQFILPLGTKSELYYEATKYLEINSVDLIIATGEPFVLFNYGSKLSAKFNTPWIADYRDLWSTKKNIKNNMINNIFFLYQEKKALRNVSFITTVSEFLKKKITNLSNKKVQVLANGFDPEFIAETTGIEQGNEIFTISHAGLLYDWHPIHSFFNIISQFKNQIPDANIRIKFYGLNNSEEVKKFVSLHFKDIEDFIIYVAKMPNLDLLKVLAKDNVMLLFNNYSYMGTKIYDYIGIKRKILFCYSNDQEALNLKEKYFDVEEINDTNIKLQEDLIRKTQSGVIIKDAISLLIELKSLYNEFKTNSLISCNSEKSENYSRRKQVGELAELIKKIIDKK